MPQPNLGQPQYGDVTKVDKFMRATKKTGGTYGPEVPVQGPGRPSSGGPAPSSPQGQTPAPQPIPEVHQQLIVAEAEAKKNFERWQQRANTAGAGPRTHEMLAAAAKAYADAARAKRMGTPFYEGV
jgi:hypothetical protein